VPLANQSVTVGASGVEPLFLQLAGFDFAAYSSIYAIPTSATGRVGSGDGLALNSAQQAATFSLMASSTGAVEETVAVSNIAAETGSSSDTAVGSGLVDLADGPIEYPIGQSDGTEAVILGPAVIDTPVLSNSGVLDGAAGIEQLDEAESSATVTIESAAMVGSDLVVTGTLLGEPEETYEVTYYGTPTGGGAGVQLAKQSVAVWASGYQWFLVQLTEFNTSAYTSIHATTTSTTGKVGSRGRVVHFPL